MVLVDGIQGVSSYHLSPPHLKELSFLPCQCMKYIYHTWMLAVIPKPNLRLNKLANGDWLFSGSSHTYTHPPMHQLPSYIANSAT